MQIEGCKKRLAPQECPFCGELQDIIVNGMDDTDPLEDGTPAKEILEDIGYSFCNCRNVFFTNWENCKQERYDEHYQQKYGYVQPDVVLRGNKDCFKQMAELTDGRKFLEIGCSYSHVLDEAKKVGFETFGMNICNMKFEDHPTITADFEKYSGTEKYDAIYAAHIFEHFNNPLTAAQKCYELLNSKGLLYIAMPDPFFVEWRNPYIWGHWHIREHHTLWDMDSFCEALEEIGFKTVYKRRNFKEEYIYAGEMNLLFQKPC